MSPNNQLASQSNTPDAIVPKVSVIIPTYNNAAYLSDAIDSVLAQNYMAVEIIIIDDGSTDNSVDVLKPYQGIVQYQYQENSGSAAARNLGIELAQGEFIVFLDADDLLLPNKFHVQTKMLENNPQLGMVHSGWLLIDQDGNEIGQRTPWEEAPKLDIESWIRVKPIKMGAMMYRRHWLNEIGGFDPSLRQSQDSDMILRLALAGCTTVWHKEMTMAYRVYPNSTIRKNAPAQHRYLMQVLDKAFAHPNMPTHLKVKANTYRYYTLRWAVWHIFNEGFVNHLHLPLEELARYTHYDRVDSAFDVYFYVAAHMWQAKRPFSQIEPLEKSLHQQFALTAKEQTQINKFTSFIFNNGYFSLIEKNPHATWQFWKTAVFENTPFTASPEETLTFVLTIWETIFVQQKPFSAVPNQVTLTLNVEQFITFGQHCIVHNFHPISPKRLNMIWEIAKAEGWAPANEPSGLVSWLLTFWGQATLRRRPLVALQALFLAIGQTLRYPKAVKAWGDFFKTAVAYYTQNRHFRI